MTASRQRMGNEVQTEIPILSAYPGGDLVARGLVDLRVGRASAEAALVEVAWTRLAELGLPVARRKIEGRDAELVLYARLGVRDPQGDVYGTYCAWLDQLVSFLSAFQSGVSLSG